MVLLDVVLPKKRMQLTALHIQGTSDGVRTGKSPQPMRNPLGRHEG